MTITLSRAAKTCGAVGLLCGASLSFLPPRFQSTASLMYLHRAGLPWLFWTLLFFAYGLLLISSGTSRLPGQLGVMAIGWWGGAAIFACFWLSLANSVYRTNTVANPITLYALLGYTILHVIFAFSTQRTDANTRR